MKPHSLRLLAFFAAVLLLPALSRAERDETPVIPVGSLSAFPEIVQTGTHPELTWDITVPETVDDVVDIEGPGTLRPKRCLIMDVRVLGASVKRVWTNHYGQVVNWEWVPTEARINHNGQGYDRIFFDTNDDVNPNSIVHSQTVEENDSIDFGARYVRSNGYWSTWYSSTNSSHNVVALKDGDTPPTTTPLYQQPSIESFILPYLDDEGKIKLGARDIIYLMELTHTNRNHGGFDLQDMALLVTFYDEVQTEDGVVDCHGDPLPGGSGGGGNDDDDDGGGPPHGHGGDDDDDDDGGPPHGHGGDEDDDDDGEGEGAGNPGNHKNVGNAGENPDGGDDWGGGSRGKSDGRGRRRR